MSDEPDRGVEVVLPPGQEPGENSAFLVGPGGREVAVNVTESTLGFVTERDREVDAVVQRTDTVDRDLVNAFATHHDGDIELFVLGTNSGGGNGDTRLDFRWLDTVADARVYEPGEELADHLFDETAVGDREVSVNPIKTAGGYDEVRQTALDVRLAETPDPDRGAVDRLRSTVRDFRNRPTRDAADNRRSMLLVGGEWSPGRSPLRGLGKRLRSGTPAVGAVTHPNQTSSSRSELLDELPHETVVFAGGEYYNDREESAQARGASVVHVTDTPVALRVTTDGVTVTRGAPEAEAETLVDGIEGMLPDATGTPTVEPEESEGRNDERTT